MIKFLKLINGDNIVAKVEEFNDYYRVIWPVRIYEEETEQGVRNKIVPYASHVLGHTFNLNKNRIMFVGAPVPQLEEYYVKNNASMLPTASGNTPVSGNPLDEN